MQYGYMNSTTNLQYNLHFYAKPWISVRCDYGLHDQISMVATFCSLAFKNTVVIYSDAARPQLNCVLHQPYASSKLFKQGSGRK
jgi:hypothetical protein